MDRARLIMSLLRVNRKAAIRLSISAFSRLARVGFSRVIDLLVNLQHFIAVNFFKSVSLVLEKSELLNYIYRRFLLEATASPRWFIPYGQDPISFFSSLNDQDVNYCVLRWGETITTGINTQEDIDILVEDDNLEQVQSMLSKSSYKGQPVDLYSVSGVRGADYAGRPYFPEKLARQLLRNSAVRGVTVRMPKVQEERLSLVYHLVFHKKWGYSVVETFEQSRILQRLSSLHGGHKDMRINVGREVVQKTLERLNDLRMLPPLEDCRMIVRNVASSPLATLLSEKGEISETKVLDNYLFFVCRESLFKFSGERNLVEVLSMDGLSVFKRIRLTESQKRVLAKFSRGGNWKRGPYLRGGGGPAELWVVVDSFPEMEVEGVLRRNLILEQKSRWRSWVNRHVSFFQHSNPFHTADDFIEGLEMLEAIGEVHTLENMYKQAEYFQGDSEVEIIESIGRKKGRSRVWRVREPGNDSAFVKKVFAHGFESYLRRELDFYKNFSDLEMIPKLLGWDQRSLVLPELVKMEPSILELTPTEVRQVVQFIITVNARGFSLVNFTPENLMRDRNGGLRVIDFEFAQRFTPPEKGYWHEAPDFIGLPFDNGLVRPDGWTFGLDHWDVVWASYAGTRLSEIRRWRFD